MKAYLEVRSQHQVGGFFGGPDTYVAVQIVPDGVKRLQCLNRKIAEKRGIKLIYCGEGWSKNNKTNRSSLNKAINKAKNILEKINNTFGSVPEHVERSSLENYSLP